MMEFMVSHRASTSLRAALVLACAVAFLPGCKRTDKASEARKRPAIESIPPPVIPVSDRKPALETEIKRIQARLRDHKRVRDRLASVAPRLDHLFRADRVSRSRARGLQAIQIGVETGPSEVVVNQIMASENRWTITIESKENEETLEPRPTQLFAQAVANGLPGEQQVELSRYWEDGPYRFNLGFVHPPVVGRSNLGPQAPLPEDMIAPGGPAEDPPPSPFEPNPNAPDRESAPPEALPTTGPTEALPGSVPEAPGTPEGPGAPMPATAPTELPGREPERAPTEFGRGSAPERPTQIPTTAAPVPAPPSDPALVLPEGTETSPVPETTPSTPKSEEELALESEIATLEEQLDEPALLQERRTLVAIEEELQAIERHRLPSTPDRSFRIEPADIRTTLEQGGLTIATFVDQGPIRYVEIPSRALIIEVDGTMAAAVAAIGQVDALGALLGDLIVTRQAEGGLRFRLSVYVLSR